jgi:hypothetical protein
MSKIYDYDQICDEVKRLDDEIRFAGVINEIGRQVAGGIIELNYIIFFRHSLRLAVYC